MQEMVLIEDLHVHKANVRRGVGDVRELAASIKAVGIIEPLVVTTQNSVIAGSRRLAAARMAGLKQVPVVRRDADHPSEIQELMLVENLQRAELAPLEEAAALQLLVDFGRDQRDIAKRIGRTQPWVQQRLSLLRLPAKAIDALDNGVITIEQARDLAKVAETPEIVDRVVDRIAGGEKTLSVGGAVTTEQRHLELEQELEARKATLEAAGTKVIVETNLERTGGLRRLWDGDLAEHEECGAVVLRVGYNRVDEEPVCTDPDRHQDADDVRKPDVATARAEREAEKKILEAAHEARIAACQEVCRRMPSKHTAELIELGYILLERDDFNELDLAAKILELPVPQEDADDAAAATDALDTLDLIVEHAARSDRARHHAALAMALAGVEMWAKHGALWHAGSRQMIDLYYALIGTVGYEPTEAELKSREPATDGEEAAL